MKPAATGGQIVVQQQLDGDTVVSGNHGVCSFPGRGDQSSFITGTELFVDGGAEQI